MTSSGDTLFDIDNRRGHSGERTGLHARRRPARETWRFHIDDQIGIKLSVVMDLKLLNFLLEYEYCTYSSTVLYMLTHAVSPPLLVIVFGTYDVGAALNIYAKSLLTTVCLLEKHHHLKLIQEVCKSSLPFLTRYMTCACIRSMEALPLPVGTPPLHGDRQTGEWISTSRQRKGL